MPTRLLVLIRHAQAGDGPVDLGRPLTINGHHDARAVGEWLARQHIDPDHAITSPARRAVETWEDAATQLPQAPIPAIDERVYDLNTVAALLAVIREVNDEVATLALVAHNPGIAALATALDDGRGDQAARTALAGGYGTSATTVFAVAGAWTDLAPQTATIRSFTVPSRPRG